ncbi:MAG: hypothetical protein K8F31_04175, partial [Roseovarius sp.]|nr:hypothetical protein [Roseovarius sp.]
IRVRRAAISRRGLSVSSVMTSLSPFFRVFRLVRRDKTPVNCFLVLLSGTDGAAGRARGPIRLTPLPDGKIFDYALEWQRFSARTGA